jgi:uracil-DNA glycosylase
MRHELASLARQAHGIAELDRLFGIPCSPVPSLRPLNLAAPPAPAAKAPAAKAPAAKAPAAKAAPGQSKEARLHALAQRLAGCRKCPLSQGRTNLVFGQGDANAELVFVGEGPGFHEDQSGLAFVGKAGELLTKMISAMGLSRDEVFIANVVKCRPPNNRSPHPDEMGTCLPFLREQLKIIQPKVICSLGKTAAVGLGLIGSDESLGRNRGFKDWDGIPAMITYHPAYLLRQPSDKGKTWKDLQQLFPYLERRRTS